MGTFADACDAVLSDPGGDHSLYTTLAPLYERIVTTSGPRYDSQLHALTQRVPTSARVVVDTYCGVGRFLPALAERHGAAVGLDTSGALLSLAADTVAASEGISLVEADVADPEFELNRRFDAAVALDYRTARLHGDALERGLAATRRHLHDGATVVVDALADARPLSEDSPSVFRDERYTVERAVDVYGASDGTGDLVRIADYRVTDEQTRDGAVARERESLRTFTAGTLADALDSAGFREVRVESNVVEHGSLLATGRV